MLLSLIQSNKNNVYSDYIEDQIVDLLDYKYTVPNTYSYDVYRVPPGFEARPDLISYNIYGDDMTEDVLNKLNCNGNPFELNVDNYIITPIWDDTRKFIILGKSTVWNEKQTKSSSQSSSITSTKKTTSKNAGPNTARKTDKRFNIDPLSRVVIY